MGFGDFLTLPEIKLRVVTCRNVFQNTAQETSRFGEDYERLSAVIMLDPKDITRLSIKDGETVALRNGHGKVVVKAQRSGQEDAHSGIAYMLNSPWSNALVPVPDTGKGVPKYKDFEVTVQGSKGEKVTGIKQLF